MTAQRGQPRKCENCVYACPLQDGPRTLLICANTPDAPGQIVRVEPEGTCRNFGTRHCSRRRKVERQEPPQPPNDEIRYIPLTQGKFAIVDAADYEELAQYHWHAIGNERDGFYAGRRLPSGKRLYMHRAIMDPPEGMVVDHINGNRSDNRRANLRNCLPEQNVRNAKAIPGSSSRFKGVCFDKRTGKWVAAIHYDGKRIHLGYFDNEIEAAKAYDRKARELFGEFARLNFPEDYA